MRVRVEGISFSYDSHRVLDDVTLDIKSGVLTCVVGPNGAGKTTLLKTIASVLKPSEGVIYLDGKDYRNYSPREIAKIVAYSEPNISKSIPVRVLDFILTARYPFQGRLQYFENMDDLGIVDEVSRELKISHLLGRLLDQVSSGELQRILIAAALVKRPKVLLLDEPSAFLDIRYRFEVLEFIKKFTIKYNISTVIALHDIHLASVYCDEVVLMDRGHIIICGRPQEVFTSKVIEDVYGIEVELVPLVNESVVAIPKPKNPT